MKLNQLQKTPRTKGIIAVREVLKFFYGEDVGYLLENEQIEELVSFLGMEFDSEGEILQ